MRDDDCVAFLQWALPRLGMRWPGFRKVRRQVCRRIARRMAALGLDGPDAYRERLLDERDEWDVLAALCRVTISRFFRDRGVFEHLAEIELPRLAAEATRDGDGTVRAWSAGCASGEEPYSVALAWHLGPGGSVATARLELLGTDIDPGLLRRARRACYPPASLRELPDAWIDRAFAPADDGTGELCLRAPFREGVAFSCQDIRRELPGGRFDLGLCRNLVFTYFDATWQARLAARIADALRPGGLLVIGAHETVPQGVVELRPARAPRGVLVRH